MKLALAFCLVGLGVGLVGCGEPQGPDLSKVQAQPAADLEKGKNAKTIEEWASANPNNGAPGSGEGSSK
ncbi:MAG: hypothetical protein BGO01_15325 [Armatimonadetes bacterium 55-13]|nr:hypothetical protein [Armatimonadota bacterium]OJU65237.1 MAG: hypothetical protein BGO01_15325 [Armatimonadetes bacterium 55-13]